MINRKQRKYQHTVEKQTGIKCTTFPTKYIAICNSGLVNGLSEETVYEHFSKYGKLQHIYMLPGKSCCFLSYEDVVSASNTFEQINGKLNIAQYNKPVFLSFIEDLPENLVQNLGFISNPPNGLVVLENFISEDEEKILLSLNNFDDSTSSLKHRQVRHYGYEFKYDINNVDINSPLSENIPMECDFLWERLQKKRPDVQFSKPDQLTVNCYKSGHGIPSHVDTHSAFEDPIFILSLNSSIMMDFKNDEGQYYDLLIPNRSFIVMSGESRYGWTHGITPRKMDILQTMNGLTVSQRGTRISFTFRKVRKGECNCDYHNKCDSYLKAMNRNDIHNEIAERLEETHVHDVYENIAQHFSETRHKPWPNVLNFIKSFEDGSVLVDVGCGNGKYMNCENIFQIGLDTSISLLNVCRDRGYQVLVGNCLRIPLKSNIADGVISIAVIHHLCTKERRFQAIQEMLRILKDGGKALIYVWAKEQNRNQEKSSYLKQNRKNRKETENDMVENEKVYVLPDVELPVHINRTQFQHQDVLVPWKLKNANNEGKSAENIENKQFLRFYHVFEEGELEDLCREQTNAKLVKAYYDQGNWCAILEKISHYS